VKSEKLLLVCEEVNNCAAGKAEIMDIIDHFALLDVVKDDLKNEKYFVFDGRLEEIVAKILRDTVIQKQSSFESYDHLLSLIVNELSKLVVPTLILLPLVLVNGSVDKEEIILKNRDYIIFPLTQKSGIFTNERYFLRDHIKKTIYASLPENHIINVKDAHFFNFPILAIEIHNIDSIVEREAPKINEAIYSFIRMICFNNGDEQSWFSLVNAKDFPSTYSVYYNEVGTVSSPPYDAGYGYSFRYTFEPLLDINFNELDSKLDLLSDNIDIFINLTFKAKKEINQSKYIKQVKWQNAVLLFNEAYESASKEKFETTLIILLTVLESLFISNKEKDKQNTLVKEIIMYFDSPSRNNQISETIKNLYSKRNAFVHEGKRLEAYQFYKSLNDYEGLITGMEPLKFVNRLADGHDLKYLHSLFMLCREILLDYKFVKESN
jgi:RNAse (barnase) inhibitor barstar